MQLFEDLPQSRPFAHAPKIMALLGRYNKIKMSEWLRLKSMLLVLRLKYQEATTISPVANVRGVFV